jgi:hypothetical protein
LRPFTLQDPPLHHQAHVAQWTERLPGEEKVGSSNLPVGAVTNPDYLLAIRFPVAALLRGTFQYGDLHFGHTRGSRSLSRGSHWWSHRSHTHAHTCTRDIPGSMASLVSVVKYIPLR